MIFTTTSCLRGNRGSRGSDDQFEVDDDRRGKGSLPPGSSRPLFFSLLILLPSSRFFFFASFLFYLRFFARSLPPHTLHNLFPPYLAILERTTIIYPRTCVIRFHRIFHHILADVTLIFSDIDNTKGEFSSWGFCNFCCWQNVLKTWVKGCTLFFVYYA